MSDGQDQKGEECYRQRGQRETDKEIKTIRELIASMSGDSKVNTTNMSHMAEAHKQLAVANSLTHYKLFARTEALSVSLKEIETKHSEHVKHGTQNTTDKHHRYTMLVSWVAIGISVMSVIAMVTQFIYIKATK